jgi:hypothetical protein
MPFEPEDGVEGHEPAAILVGPLPCYNGRNKSNRCRRKDPRGEGQEQFTGRFRVNGK